MLNDNTMHKHVNRVYNSINTEQELQECHHFLNIVTMQEIIRNLYSQNQPVRSGQYRKMNSTIFQTQEEYRQSYDRQSVNRKNRNSLNTSPYNNSKLEQSKGKTTPNKKNKRAKFENPSTPTTTKNKTQTNRKRKKFEHITQIKQKDYPQKNVNQKPQPQFIRIDDLISQLQTDKSRNSNSQSVNKLFQNSNSTQRFSPVQQYKVSNNLLSTPNKQKYSKYSQYNLFNSKFSPNSIQDHKHGIFPKPSFVSYQQIPYKNNSPLNTQSTLINPYYSRSKSKENKKQEFSYNNQNYGINNKAQYRRSYSPLNYHVSEQKSINRNTDIINNKISSNNMDYKIQKQTQIYKNHFKIDNKSRYANNQDNRSHSKSKINKKTSDSSSKAKKGAFYLPNKANYSLEAAYKGNNDQLSVIKSNNPLLAKFERQILGQSSQDQEIPSLLLNTKIKSEKIQQIIPLSSSKSENQPSQTKYPTDNNTIIYQLSKQTQFQSSNKSQKRYHLDERCRQSLTYLSETRIPPKPTKIQIKK